VIDRPEGAAEQFIQAEPASRLGFIQAFGVKGRRSHRSIWAVAKGEAEWWS
jgi:hypothetical protein